MKKYLLKSHVLYINPKELFVKVCYWFYYTQLQAQENIYGIIGILEISTLKGSPFLFLIFEQISWKNVLTEIFEDGQ